MDQLEKQIEAAQAEVQRLEGLKAEARGRIISEPDSERQYERDCATGNQKLINARVRGETVSADQFDKVTKDALLQKQLRNSRSNTAAQEIREYGTAITKLEKEISTLRTEDRIAKRDDFPAINAADNKLRIEVRKALDDIEDKDIAVRQTQVENIKEYGTAVAESAMKFFDENLLPELRSKVSAQSEPDASVEGTRTFSPTSKNQPDVIFTKIEHKLKPVAAWAFILEEVFDDQTVKRTLLDLLAELGKFSQMAVRNKSLTVPDWAFGGTPAYGLWTKPEHVEQVRAFLRDSGYYECI